jgi:hypothetical protein
MRARLEGAMSWPREDGPTWPRDDDDIEQMPSFGTPGCAGGVCAEKPEAELKKTREELEAAKASIEATHEYYGKLFDAHEKLKLERDALASRLDVQCPDRREHGDLANIYASLGPLLKIDPACGQDIVMHVQLLADERDELRFRLKGLEK